MQDLQVPNEDARVMQDVRNQQHSPLSQAISDFQANSNSNGNVYQIHPRASRQQECYAPHQAQQHFQPPPHQQSTHYREQYNQQHTYNRPTNDVHPGQYNPQQNYEQSFEPTQQRIPVYDNGYGPNKPREVDADNWSPGDWRNQSMAHTNQVQGGVGSAPFANDYTWNKERY
jgi:hypothetical protein